MQLNQDQQRILFRIQENAKALTQFEVLCAEFEAALDEVELPEDLEKTDPFGVAAIRSVDEKVTVEVDDAATVIAVAWLEMNATAIADQEGEISPDIFDEDGVSAFCDTRPLFGVVRACGFGSAHARRAFTRIRRDGRVVPWRAMRILGSIGEIKVPKRKRGRQQANRVKPLAPCFVQGLDKGEIARAKAGNLFYTLFVQDGRYEASRGRKVPVRFDRQRRADDHKLMSEADVDVISGFKLPFKPSDDAQQLAVEHFVSFLAEQGYTYQRLVYRTEAA